MRVSSVTTVEQLQRTLECLRQVEIGLTVLAGVGFVITAIALSPPAATLTFGGYFVTMTVAQSLGVSPVQLLAHGLGRILGIELLGGAGAVAGFGDYSLKVQSTNPDVLAFDFAANGDLEFHFGRSEPTAFVWTLMEGDTPIGSLVLPYTPRAAPVLPVLSADRAVLEELYHATNGPNWARNTNWLTDAALGEWHGVETDSTGRVTSLELTENNLSGPIPSELGNLANLELLALNHNDLRGSIPAEIGNLASLQELFLAYTNVSGPIPAEIGNLTNLEWLAISFNDNLNGPIPVELGKLANLKALGLGFNDLSGPIPIELGNLTNLEELLLGANDLSGPIPIELGNLTNLEYLLLTENDLSGPIPAALGNLPNLFHLYLSENNLNGPVPDELGNLTRLRVLLLDSNDLSEPLPSSMTNLRQLGDLRIDDNAGLCAPADAVFQEWLATLREFRGNTCGEDEPVTVPGAPPGLTLAASDAALAASWTGAGERRRLGHHRLQGAVEIRRRGLGPDYPRGLDDDDRAPHCRPDQRRQLHRARRRGERGGDRRMVQRGDGHAGDAGSGTASGGRGGAHAATAVRAGGDGWSASAAELKGIRLHPSETGAGAKRYGAAKRLGERLRGGWRGRTRAGRSAGPRRRVGIAGTSTPPGWP